MFIIDTIPATKIPLTKPQILTYFTAHHLKVGSLVLVPLYQRKVPAIVINIFPLKNQKMAIRKADFELKNISKVISQKPVLNSKQISLAKWMSDYYYCPIGSVIKMILPKIIQKSKIKMQNDNLKFKNIKTRQKLILVPEIHFIQKIAQGYEKKCPSQIAILHSQLTNKQYFENWRKMRNGEDAKRPQDATKRPQAKIIIGTRLALFAPFFNLKEIIVEEEHNPNYKSLQTPRFHIRETALKLASLWPAKIIFKSPTPLIETYWLAKNKKIHLEKLEAGSWKLKANIIDMRQEIKQGNYSIFSRSLQSALKTTLENNGQAILFINRRGAATFILCRDCGYVVKCPNCDVPLVYHLAPIRLLCHHCNWSDKPPSLCPNCSSYRIKFFGAGTQKVEAELKKLFPQIQSLRLDSDTVSNQITEDKIIKNFKSKKIQVLIGTQMIFNQNLKKVPLVAMVSADTLLNLPDFYSNERTFQIIAQLKKLTNKNFIIQTYNPSNLAIKKAVKNDYQSFYHQEIKTRQELNYPPFSQIIKLIFRHKNQEKAEEEAKILAEKLKQQISHIRHHPSSITLLGPAPAFIAKVQKKFIWQIIIKLKTKDLKLKTKLLSIVPPDWIIDIDPVQII